MIIVLIILIIDASLLFCFIKIDGKSSCRTKAIVWLPVNLFALTYRVNLIIIGHVVYLCFVEC